MSENNTIYSAIAVANWIIEKNKTDNCKLTHLKTQKLLYFAQGWHLGNYETPLFEDDIQAWKYGPVVYPVYKALYHYKNNEITNLIEGLTIYEGQVSAGFPVIDQHDNDTQKYLLSYWENYAHIDTWTLVDFAHQKGSPLHQIIDNFNNTVEEGDIIHKELMKEYFKSLLNKGTLND